MLVGDDFDFLSFHHGDDGVRGAEIDSDNLAHGGLRSGRTLKLGAAARRAAG
jgi:hypothetical protein